MNNLTELEQLAANYFARIEEVELSPNYLDGVNRKLYEQGKKIYESLKPKPVFPSKGGWFVDGDGEPIEMASAEWSEEAAQGNTAYTREAAEKLRDRRAAKTRVIEAIHKANGGERGFIAGQNNYYFEYYHNKNEFDIECFENLQNLEPELYLSEEAADTLIKDKSFLADYRLAMRVE